MLKRPLILLSAAVFITSCQVKKESGLKQQESEKPGTFFPVTQYILGQLSELDSLPVTPLKITSKNGRSDSIWMKKQEIRTFVQPFITPVIDSIRWHKYFSEKAFLDQTINAYTFSYDPVVPLPDSIELKRWDVYVDPVNNKVKRIYIVKQINNSTSPQTIQLTWKSGYFCKITTITENRTAEPQIKEEKLIWNFDE